MRFDLGEFVWCPSMPEASGDWRCWRRTGALRAAIPRIRGTREPRSLINVLILGTLQAQLQHGSSESRVFGGFL